MKPKKTKEELGYEGLANAMGPASNERLCPGIEFKDFGTGVALTTDLLLDQSLGNKDDALRSGLLKIKSELKIIWQTDPEKPLSCVRNETYDAILYLAAILKINGMNQNDIGC